MKAANTLWSVTLRVNHRNEIHIYLLWCCKVRQLLSCPACIRKTTQLYLKQKRWKWFCHETPSAIYFVLQKQMSEENYITRGRRSATVASRKLWRSITRASSTVTRTLKSNLAVNATEIYPKQVCWVVGCDVRWEICWRDLFSIRSALLYLHFSPQFF